MTRTVRHERVGAVVCRLAPEYLLSFSDSGVTEELLDHDWSLKSGTSAPAEPQWNL